MSNWVVDRRRDEVLVRWRRWVVVSGLHPASIHHPACTRCHLAGIAMIIKSLSHASLIFGSIHTRQNMYITRPVSHNSTRLDQSTARMPIYQNVSVDLAVFLY